MTINEYIAKLNQKIKALEENDRALFLAASSVHGKMVTRIFTEGLNSNGTKIGSYNTTKPLYVNQTLLLPPKKKQALPKY